MWVLGRPSEVGLIVVPFFAPLYCLPDLDLFGKGKGQQVG